MKKRLLSLILVFVLVFGMLPVNVFAAGETVTEISTQAGLSAMKDGGSFRLAADITLDSSFVSIDTYRDIVLDGNGYTITLAGKPLFYSLSSASQITNLVLAGTVQGDDYNKLGALASANSGTVRNCISRVSVTYNGSNPNALIGGFIGDMYSGTIANCYSEASFQAEYAASGAIANIGSFNTGKLSHCYAKNADRIGVKLEFSMETFEDAPIAIDPASVSSEILGADADLEAVADALNTYRQEGDCRWAAQNGTLTLVPNGGEEKIPATAEEIAALNAAVASAESVPADKIYTAATWSELIAALDHAKAVLAQAEPEQAAVAAAAAQLNDAVTAMAARNTSPLDASGYQEIATADELAMMVPGGHYRLTADIDLSGEAFWFGSYETMNCVLDGDGHTVTLPNAPLWNAIGSEAVIQNLGLKGTAIGNSNIGALAGDCSGLILNCWTQAEIKTEGQNGVAKNAGGFVSNLSSGGAIVNSYAVGSLSAKGTVGALSATAEKNTLIQSSYWLSGSAVGSGEGRILSSAQKSRSDFYSEAVLDALNAGRGTYGLSWGVSSEGWPYHGEDQGYTPDSGLELTFTPWNGGDSISFNSEDGLTLSLFDICREPGESYNLAGMLSCGSVSDASWSYEYTGATEKYPIWVGEDGKIALFYEGTHTAYVSGTGLAERVSFPVHVITGDISDLRVLQGETLVSDGTILEVEGSEDVTLTVQGMVGGQWKTLPFSLFTFQESENLYLTGNIFHATKPGDSTITISGLGHEAVVQITSSYVPVTGLVVHPNGTFVLHERGAMGGGFNDLTLGYGAGTVSVVPANASYQEWKLESSDPSVAEYIQDFVLAVQPYKPGTVTLTATSLDPNLEAPVTASSSITLVYKNPATSVAVEDSELTVKENETIKLPITFIGKLDEYHVSEAGMVWSCQGDGEIQISRNGSGMIVREEGAKEYCVSNDQYTILGLAAGTVTVTGTPVDTTGGAKPVTFTVTVESGVPEVPADNDKLVNEGISAAQRYLLGLDVPLTYGNEWNIFSLTRSGAVIAPADVDAYLASVKKAYQNPGNSELKPTTLARVALTLTCLGKDASDFEGLDFIEMLCSSDRIPEGSNEPMWALIALDCGCYPVPEGAKWARGSLISGLLKFQNSEGFFGLASSESANIDLTGMAIQALAPYYETNAAAKEAADKALAWLQTRMDRNCAYGGVEATAQVLVALTALDRDPLNSNNGFVKSVARNLITAVSAYQNGETGAFTFEGKDNNASTTQGLYALEAYRRYRDGENALYDLADVDLRATLERRVAAAGALVEADYAEESWNALPEALAAAKKALANENATEEELMAADTALAAAIAALVPVSGGTDPDPGDETITVSFRLIGDTKHGEGAHKEYVTWIPTVEVEIRKDGTVYDAFTAALEENGMAFKESQYGYIGAVQAPAVLDGYWLEEFDNGQNSGWMYTVNGSHPGVGLRDYTLEDGNRVIWHYTDDYEAESGGWEEVPDEKPAKPANPVNVELRKAYETTAGYLKKQTPSTGSVGGEWLVLGLARSEFGVTDQNLEAYKKAVFQFVRDNVNDKEQLHKTKSTENARIIATLTALGVDPTNVEGHNLLQGLTDMNYLKKQGINGPIWALIAFDTKNYEIPGDLTREDLIHEILGRQTDDGSWSTVDMTAMALYALAPYVDQNAEVKAAVEKALNDLSALQNENGGFAYGNQGETVESCAQVITALSALGIDAANDPRFVKGKGENAKSVIDAFLTFYMEDGSFKHNYAGSGVNQMATEQALYAMAAYYRNLNGQNRLFDMTGVKTETVVNKAILKTSISNVEKLDAGDYTAESWKALESALKHAKLILSAWNATQAEVDGEVMKLNNAVAALVKAPKPEKPCTGGAGCPCRQFKDVKPGDWYHPYMDFMVDRGLLLGTSSTTVSPNGTMTRAMLVTILYRYEGQPKADGKNVFTDVPTKEYYYDAVRWAAKEGIVLGTSATKFSPNAKVTREQMVTILYRYAKYKGIDVSRQGSLKAFPDAGRISDYAKPAFAWAVGADVIHGADGKLLSQNSATRAEVSSMLMYFITRVMEQ